MGNVGEEFGSLRTEYVDRWRSALGNVAAVCLKTGRYGEVIRMCEDILRVDRSNAQAMDRCAYACHAVGDSHAARAHVTTAACLLPQDATERVQEYRCR